MLRDQILDLLLPHLTGVAVVDLQEVGTRLCITACTVAERASCPACGTSSRRVHDRYGRRLADLGISGRVVTIALTVRRFRCDAAHCPRRTFAEQVEGLTFRHSRRSRLQRATLEVIGCHLAGRAGSRLAAMLRCPASPNTLLRRVRALPADPPERSPQVLGGGRLRSQARARLRHRTDRH
ncbi:transposase family protein [Embleya sp. NPDC059237]|uniref:transposase family protein n=1 Tax=Embleya sp. NPDC059237 TaxID=3346784 RepID=UPI00368080D7